MTCQRTDTPAPGAIDIAALKAKYIRERQRRMHPEGEEQYQRSIASYVEDPHSPVAPRAPLSETIDVAVLGAGWGGILAAYHLTRAGVTSFRNIDHAGDFGGVWYWNRYPGIQCDNDAYCYLPLLEETGYMPSKKFCDGWEIQRYSRLIAEKFGFSDRALFHTLVTSLRWDESIKRWHVGTNRGDDIRARFVVMAGGVLNMPKLPGVTGIETFQGKTFHTARWDYDYTGGDWENPVLDQLSDKRVAIVGTGASSVQAVPFLAKHAKQLYVIQRTPSSVDERPNPATDPEWVKSLKPGWQDQRKANFHRAAMEFLAPGEPDLICDIWTEISRNLSYVLKPEELPHVAPEKFMQQREVVDYQVMERLRRRVDSSVKRAEIAEALKPYYRFLCKRPLSNDEYYPVFNRSNVALIDVSHTRGIERLTERGFLVEGRECPVDCVIFASGFEVTSALARRWGIDEVWGRNGASIYDHWADGPKTLHGTMTHNFPNQFFTGYIQGGLNASVTEQLSKQTSHIAYIIEQTLKRGCATVEPTKKAQDAYVKRFDELQVDLSEYQATCPPSYFNNEGAAHPKWALFRSWGHGWNAFQQLLEEWRTAGDLAGLTLEK